MGMPIDTNAASSYQPATASNFQQRQQAFQALAQALSSGDLTSAQQAFSTLTANQSQRQSTDTNSPLAKLGQALQSGALAAAQTAFGALKGGQGHQGHHHHHGGGAGVTATTGTTATASTPATESAAVGGIDVSA